MVAWGSPRGPPPHFPPRGALFALIPPPLPTFCTHPQLYSCMGYLRLKFEELAGSWCTGRPQGGIFGPPPQQQSTAPLRLKAGVPVPPCFLLKEKGQMSVPCLFNSVVE